MIDSFHIKNGIILVPPYSDIDAIKKIIEETSLKDFHIIEKNHIEIFKILQAFNPNREKESNPVIVIDHSFSVKGVGEVILGFVKKGLVKKHDNLKLIPIGKDVIIRSIQIQDKDVETASAGSRVGFAIRGASAEEMNRGSIICHEGEVLSSKKLTLTFSKNKFYQQELKDGVYHVSIGMQTLPINLQKKDSNEIIIESEKEMIYGKEDIFLLLDLNAKKSRVIGSGICI
jgi:selenocysteine-specific translation elongation factor